MSKTSSFGANRFLRWIRSASSLPSSLFFFKFPQYVKATLSALFNLATILLFILSSNLLFFTSTIKTSNTTFVLLIHTTPTPSACFVVHQRKSTDVHSIGNYCCCQHRSRRCPLFFISFCTNLCSFRRSNQRLIYCPLCFTNVRSFKAFHPTSFL